MTHSAALTQVGLVVLLVITTLGVALVARALRFPYTLALVLVGLMLGVLHAFPTLQLEPDLVLLIFLPALLFEGAWSVETQTLKRDWLVVFLLAVPGLAVSLLLVAVVAHWGAGLSWPVALLLGAIVSPTDPIAVIALLRQMGMPRQLLTIVEGESLFNDGVGAAAFELVLGALLLSLTAGGELVGLSHLLVVGKVLWLLGGGLVLGTTIGYVVSHLVRIVDDPLLETAVTFSVAYGSYLLGVLAGTSGLLTVVAASLMLGSYGRRIGMSERTREQVDSTWQFTSYLANSLLFLLVGVSLGATPVRAALPAIALAIVSVIAGRAAMVYLLIPLHNWMALHLALRDPPLFPEGLRPTRLPLQWRPLIILSGLRGALSLALALSVPAQIHQHGLLTSIVFGVVLVTLVGQGIGLRLLLPRLREDKTTEGSSP